MLIIPVLDLKGGKVVRARGGDRDHYLPICSKLCSSPEPAAVLEALLALHPFHCVYIADLDAITGKGDHHGIVHGLSHRFPQLTIWLDAGFDTTVSLSPLENHSQLRPVLGSETLQQPQLLRNTPGAILSLDFRGDQFLGNPELLQPALWPDTVIAMTLQQVGSHSGPDWQRLTQLQQTGSAAIVAAGGVRDDTDLRQLQRQGIAGVLVASALHDGRLDASALQRYLPDD